MQRKGSVPFLCVNVNVLTDAMLNLDANAQAKVNVDNKCEQALTKACDFQTISILFV